MIIPERELTIDDILTMHRGWLTHLFVEEKMPESEILRLLHEQHFAVSFQQVHSFLRQWGLIPALSSTIDDSTPILLSQLLSGIALLDSKRSEIYSARSLPSLPVTTPSTSCSSLSTQKEDFFYDQEEENYRLDSTPASMTDGSLPLEAFLKDYQSHEKLAVDLTPRSFFAWAGDATRAASSEVQGVRHADSCNNKERRENSDGGDET